jgi:plasmid maintenance system antidote protein VapI
MVSNSILDGRAMRVLRAQILTTKEGRGLSVSDLAKTAGLAELEVDRALNGGSGYLTPTMAVALLAALGVAPEVPIPNET